MKALSSVTQLTIDGDPHCVDCPRCDAEAGSRCREVVAEFGDRLVLGDMLESPHEDRRDEYDRACEAAEEMRYA